MTRNREQSGTHSRNKKTCKGVLCRVNAAELGAKAL